ncbi:MAG: response regulator [Candidatus Lokiarchaeota archaeon]|nr:response regulator [Candidatus Lokiarchaeota archaeon]
MITEQIQKTDEMLQYEQETGKFAIYRGIVTESFKKWQKGMRIYNRDKERVALYISEEEKKTWQRFIESQDSLNISKLIRKAVSFYIEHHGNAGSFEKVLQVSHELKTPLTIIKGLSELLLSTRKGRLDPDVEARIKEILAKSITIETLIKSVVDKPETIESKYDILVVDDDPPTVDLLTGYFEFQRLKVKGLLGSASVLKELVESRPKVLLLDVIMPDLDGFSLCRQVKNDPRLKDTKIIFLTAIPESHVQKRMDDVGADGYILKPFNLSTLDMVKKYL